MAQYSILIPTRNRHHYLQRSVEYYSAFTDVDIVICDSSDKPYTRDLPSNICYKHFPGMTFAQKLFLASQDLTSKYLLMCADDDFLIKQGIETSVSFLDAHDDYGSTQGNYVAYYYLKGRMRYIPLYTSGINLDINDNSIQKRVSRYFGSGIQLFYCVHRAEQFRKIFELAAEKILSLNLLEYHIGYISLMMGKHKVLPVFYGCRELIYNSAGKLAGIDELSTKPEYKEQYDQFISINASFLAKCTGMAEQESQEFMLHLISAYISSDHARKFYRQRKKMKLIKKVIPGSVRTLISNLRFDQMANKQSAINLDLANRFPGFPFGDNADAVALESIEKLIVKHNI